MLSKKDDVTFEDIREYLASQGLTFSDWLKQVIDEASELLKTSIRNSRLIPEHINNVDDLPLYISEHNEDPENNFNTRYRNKPKTKRKKRIKKKRRRKL